MIVFVTQSISVIFVANFVTKNLHIKIQSNFAKEFNWVANSIVKSKFANQIFGHKFTTHKSVT